MTTQYSKNGRESSEFVQNVLRELRRNCYAPGSDDDHMDSRNLLDGVRVLIHTALGSNTELTDDEQLSDPALGERNDRDTQNREYPDFFHMINGKRCEECVDSVKRIYAIEQDLQEMETQTLIVKDGRSELTTSGRVVYLIEKAAYEDHVESAASSVLRSVRSIYHTDAKRQMLPEHLRETVDLAEIVHGREVWYDLLHSLLEEPSDLNVEPLNQESTPQGSKECGYRRTATGTPCQNRILDGHRCAAGHPSS